MAQKSARIGYNIVANYFGQGWAALVALVFAPAYIEILGLEAYGLIGFFAVLQSTLAIFDFGISATLMREAACYQGGISSKKMLQDLLYSAEILCSLSNSILALLFWFIADTLEKNWFHINSMDHESISLTIKFMAIVIAFRLQEGIYRGLLLGLNKQIVINLTIAGLSTARYIGGLFVVYFISANLVVFFVWQLLISILSLFTLLMLTKKYMPTKNDPPVFNIASISRIWRFSAGMALISGLSGAMANMDRLILSGYLSLDQYGQYSFAAAAAGILYLLSVPILQAFYPDMVKAYARGDRVTLVKLHHMSSQLVVVCAGSVAINFMFFSKEILFIWSNNINLANSTSFLLIILTAAALANSIGYIGHNLQVISGSTNIIIVANILTIILTVIFLPILVGTYGVIGCVSAWLCIVVLQVFILLISMHHGDLTGIGLRWFLFDVMQPLFGAIMPVFIFTKYISIDFSGRLYASLVITLIFSISLISSALFADNIRAQLFFLLSSWRNYSD